MTEVRRKDPLISEAIQLLDLHLKRSNYDVAVATNTLSSVYSDFIDEEIRRCMLSPRYYLENYHVIKSESEGLKTLSPFWDSQEIFYAEVVSMLLEGKPVKVLVLKARQLGMSELAEGIIFWRTIFNETINTLIVAQDVDQADYLFSKSMRAYEYLPWWMKPEKRYGSKGRYLILDSDSPERQGLASEIFVAAANKVAGVSIGKTIRCAHLCLTDKNNILLSDGFMKSIADVEVGDSIRGKSGFVEVLNVSVREESQRGYRVIPWCNSAFPIEGTWNHEVLVGKIHRAWNRPHCVDSIKLKRLADVAKGDALIIPVKPITENGEMPPTTASKPRKQGGGSLGKDIRKPNNDHEYGFLVGLYLAEGSITPANDRNGEVTQVCISLADDEQHLADRFSMACGVKYGKPSINKDGSKTRIYHFYNAKLARWLFDNFGYTDSKRIPDWCWTVGREFLSGLVDGIVAGDGHLTPKTPEIYFTSVRYQLSCQLRDAVLSLGHGYAGIYFRQAGVHYGRNCKDSWVLCFGKEPGISMRREYGWLTAPERIKNQGSHWMYTADKSFVAVRVRSVEKIDLGLVYDIEVNSNDHLFRLPAAVTHNSELSAWQNGKTLTEQIFPTMNSPDTIAILESTARGRKGFWFELWKDAVTKWGDGRWQWKPIFIEWFRCPKKYFVNIADKSLFRLSEDEMAFRERVLRDTKFFIPDEMFNWKRMKVDEFSSAAGDEYGFCQEYPATWSEAFQASGICAFPKKKLQQLMESQCHPPKWFGEIVYTHGAPQAVKTKLTQVFDDNRNYLAGPDGERIRIPSTDIEGGRLRVWEKPEAGESYYLGADVAYGIEGRGDYSCVQILRIGRGSAPDVQVAEWHGWINPTPFGHIIVGLAKWYNNCEVAIETNEVGTTTHVEVFRNLEYQNLYRWKHPDKIRNFLTNFMGWLTTSKNRPQLITNMTERLVENTVRLYSYDLLNEMIDFGAEEEGEKMEGQTGNDDRAMAMMIALYCAHDSDYGKKAAMSPRSADLGVQKFYVLDQFGRINAECDSRNEAMAEMSWIDENGNRRIRAGWSIGVRAARSNFHNSEFSPVFDRAGPRQRLHQTFGVPTEAIGLDMLIEPESPEGEDDWRRY